MYKFTLQELKRKYGGTTADTATDEWETTAIVESSSKKVVAGTLRSMADELDPPGDGKVYR